ncbi:PAS domain S-box protein [Microvirga aerophila]|uniref:Blue-light-activated histidine kinase n=1 Tax=Microvirga aerophila TaxID=670291 RepID=A0A512C1N6_9HYPH|nr:PAS domain S-box protein [Microvirga aerophila]GEO18120.1 hypothetical protein MAE02_58160 [Microvirga aerophila]
MATADDLGRTMTGLDEGLITAELARRLSRAPDHAAESRALSILAQEMATSPRSVLRKCAELVLELCHADSAGISILEPGGENGIFRWHAIVGGLAAHLGGTIPREVSPCGVVIARNKLLLFREAGQIFPDLRGIEPRIHETLLAPWSVNGEPVGTLWAIKHTPEGQFDAENARLLQSLAHFAAAASQMTDALDEVKVTREELERRVEERTHALSEAYDRASASEARLRTALEIETVGVIYLDPEGQIIDANDAFLTMGGYSRDDLEAGRLTWQALTPPEWMAASERAIAELQATGRTTPYEKEYFRKDGSRWCALFAAKRLPDGTAFEFILDTTARKQAEEALAAELKAMTRLHELSRQVVRSADLQAMLDAILDATIELHGADFGNIQLYDEATQTLRIVVQRGFQQPFLDHFAEVDVEEGSACGMALARRERVVIDNVEQEPAYAPSLPAAREAGYLAVQSTPLFTPMGKPLGMLSTHFREPHRLSERDLRLTGIYARQASDAIATQLLTQSLQESEERFRSLVESWAQAVWETDAEGKVTTDSSSWRAYTGQNLQEWLGNGWANAIHPDDRAERERQWREAVRERRPLNAEARLQHAEGGWRWTNVHAAPLLASDGSVRKWVGMNIDITERKQAEEALRASEERQAFLLKLSDVLRPLGDAHEIQREASRVLREHLGGNRVVYSEALSDAEIVPAGADYAPDASWFSGSYRLSNYSPDLAASYQAGHVISQDDPASDPRLSDQQRRAFAADRTGGWAGVPLVKESHLVALLVATFPGPHTWTPAELALMQEVAERTWAAVERARAETAWRRFAALAEASREFIGMCDTQLVPFYVNAAGLRLVGLDSLEQAQHTPVLDFFFPEDQALIRDEFLPQVLREGRGEIEIRFRHFKTGEALWVIYSVVTLNDEHGKPSGYGTVTRDITERKKTEEALRASERQAQLLLGELQHRVRNTLAVIRSIARRTAEASKSVEDYAMHLDGRINAFARVQTAVARDPAAGLDLTELVADELLTYAAREGEQVRITGPAMRLQPKAAETFGLAIHELATNAVKHGALSVPQGRIRISWRVQNGTDPPRLIFEWKECGRPERVAKRRRRGFGTDLLERTLTYELKAKTIQAFEPDGLRCTIELPMTERLVMGNSVNMRQQD